jgi:cupin fold WbuC family metalloprotein
MKQLTDLMLNELSVQARKSPRLRANHNLHTDLDDAIQRLAIAMEPDTLVLPHRHPHTFEVLLPLRGRFVVLVFDGNGKVTARTVLGAGCAVLELPGNTWHAVLSLDKGGVIFEVKHGPYAPIAPADIAAWSHGQDAGVLNAWYAQAQVGDSFSSL